MGQCSCFGGTDDSTLSSNDTQDQVSVQDPQYNAGVNQAGPANVAAGPQAGAAGNIPREFSLITIEQGTSFDQNHLIGEGRTARVYRGTIDNQLVAIKRLKPEFTSIGDYDREVQMLTPLSHPNIINLVGFCAHEDAERIIVYEYMQLGSLHDWLHDRKAGERALDWETRMKIGAGVAKGLSYLHNSVPPVVFGDLNSSDVLLGHEFHPKLSDFGAAFHVPSENKLVVY